MEEVDMPFQTLSYNSLGQRDLVCILISVQVLFIIEDKIVIHLTNRVILRGLRRRLKEAKGRWVEEFPKSKSGNHLPRLSYFTELIMKMKYEQNLNLLQEVLKVVHIKEYVAKARVAIPYDKKVSSW
ncbi:hypothetical protein CR513_05075, partial [Mucuna pruriens]